AARTTRTRGGSAPAGRRRSTGGGPAPRGAAPPGDGDGAARTCRRESTARASGAPATARPVPTRGDRTAYRRDRRGRRASPFPAIGHGAAVRAAPLGAGRRAAEDCA